MYIEPKKDTNQGGRCGSAELRMISFSPELSLLTFKKMTSKATFKSIYEINNLLNYFILARQYGKTHQP